MSIRTIALTLRPTAAEKTALLRLQAAFNVACNYISGVAWEAQEFNKVRLQRLVYADVRRDYGLMAQHTVRAIAVVADAYKADRDTKRTFRADAAVVLDTPRLYRVKHNRARITTLDGRLHMELGIGGHQRRMLTDAVKLAEADLIRDRKGRWRLMVSAHYADSPTMGTAGVLGVDLGRTDIAVTSEGATFSGATVTATRDRYARVRRSIQHKASQGTRSTRRRARAVGKRIAGRESRFQRDINHVVSKSIVGQAVASGQAIACEDLTGIRERANRQPRGKTERRRSNSWAFHQLRLFLAYKCVAAGVPFVLINPAYTSQMCHCCFVLGARFGKRFACVNPACAWRGDADVNGAQNIALLGRSVITPGGPALCCLYQPDARATTSPGAVALSL
ncbi:MAG: transposase [Chloroflexota bacterium]|nr:transposase [Chloroflexota bacterium]